MHAEPTQCHANVRPRVVLEALGLSALLLLVFRPVVAGILDTQTGDGLYFHVLVAVGVGVLAWLRPVTWRFEAQPTLVPAALLLAAASSYVANRYTLQSHHLGAVLLVAAAWGLAGLYLRRQAWIQTAPLALLALCALPLVDALDVYLGFPLRMLTARAVGTVLHPFGMGQLTSETVVLLEGTAVQVDVPCSGVRGLWSGALFWFTATWVEARRIGWRWFTASLGFFAALVAGNGARVLCLVVLQGVGASSASTVLHLPLGLATFAGACAIGWVLLTWLPRIAITEAPPFAPRDTATSAILPTTLVALFLLAWVPAPAGRDHETPPRPLVLDGTWATPESLTHSESELFRSRGASGVGKWKLSWPGVEGQLVLVESRSYRAQHRPDICHRAAGRSIVANGPTMIAPGFVARKLELAMPKATALGYYWFQSAEVTTDDYGARVWSMLDGTSEPWVMVSLAIETPSHEPELQALLLHLHSEVQSILETHDESSSS